MAYNYIIIETPYVTAFPGGVILSRHLVIYAPRAEYALECFANI